MQTNRIATALTHLQQAVLDAREARRWDVADELVKLAQRLGDVLAWVDNERH
jgi:enoyl-CoA hydratase/carnithine racemase